MPENNWSGTRRAPTYEFTWLVFGRWPCRRCNNKHNNIWVNVGHLMTPGAVLCLCSKQSCQADVKDNPEWTSDYFPAPTFFQPNSPCLTFLSAVSLSAAQGCVSSSADPAPVRKIKSECLKLSSLHCIEDVLVSPVAPKPFLNCHNVQAEICLVMHFLPTLIKKCTKGHWEMWMHHSTWIYVDIFPVWTLECRLRILCRVQTFKKNTQTKHQ